MDDFSVPKVNSYDTTFVRLVKYPLLLEMVRALDDALTYFGLSIQTNAETYRITMSHHAEQKHDTANHTQLQK